jgi:hypothetical protein
VPPEHRPLAAVEDRGRVALAQQGDAAARDPARHPDRLDARVLRAQAERSRHHPAPAGDDGEQVLGRAML